MKLTRSNAQIESKGEERSGGSKQASPWLSSLCPTEDLGFHLSRRFVTGEMAIGNWELGWEMGE